MKDELTILPVKGMGTLRKQLNYIGALIVVVVLVWLISDAVRGVGEHEGVINIDYMKDCKVVIYPKTSDYLALDNNYTCSYVKDGSGNIVDGVCVHTKISNGVCDKAYIYRVGSRVQPNQ